MVHETVWIAQGIGEASAKGDRSFAERPEHRRSRQTGRCVVRFGVPVAGSACSRRRQSLGIETCTGTSSETGRQGDTDAPGNSSEGCSGLWVPKRHLDPEAHGSRDSEGIRSKVPSVPRLEAPEESRMELPSSREACSPARRSGNRTLEAVQVAGDKKKGPQDLVPTWPSSMKAAFCSSQRFAGLGGQRDRPRSFDTTTDTTAFRHWLLSPSLRVVNTWVSTFDSSRRPSRLYMSLASFRCSFVICEATSFCCGTTHKFTRGPSLRKSGSSTRVCTLNGSQAMLRNSILSNRSGRTSRDTAPTVCFSTSRTSGSAYTETPGGSGDLKASCAHLCFPPSYPVVNLHYFSKER